MRIFSQHILYCRFDVQTATFHWMFFQASLDCLFNVDLCRFHRCADVCGGITCSKFEDGNGERVNKINVCFDCFEVNEMIDQS